MNNADKDIFNLLDNIPYDEKIQLLDCLNVDETNVGNEQKNKIKSSVMIKLKNKSPRKNKIKGGIIAASIILCIILSGFSPFGQKALAEIAEKLYFIPGLGKAVVNKEADIYILPSHIQFSHKGSNITISSITKDNTNMTINMYANNPLQLSKLTIEDESGNQYTNFMASTGIGDNWIGTYNFSNIPNEVNNFKILLSDTVKIPIKLKMAESYSDFQSMGPTDIKNNFGITLVYQYLADKIQFNLIQHQSQNKHVYLYGKSDIEGHNHINVLINDDKDKSYTLNHPTSYMGTLSEFSFTPDNNSVNYTVHVPEITLKYAAANEIILPMPAEGETSVNKTIEMNGFPLKITRILREGNKVKVFVDTNFNEDKPENLSTISLDMNAMSLNMYKWNFTNQITTESYEFNINPKDKKLKIKFSEMYTIMKGPWTFEINKQ